MGEDRENERFPSWNGEATKFDDYCEEARWYRAGTKTADRFLCVARLRQQLRGPAESVAQNTMNHDEYETADGLEKYLKMLADSPLGRQPVPDALQRIVRYDLLIRRKGEQMPDYIVREGQRIAELSRSTKKVRHDKQRRLEARQETGAQDEDASTEVAAESNSELGSSTTRWEAAIS